MADAAIKATLKEIIAKKVGGVLEASDIQDDTDLITFGLKSLIIVDIAAELELAFGVVVLDLLENMDVAKEVLATVESLASFIEANMQQD